MGITRATPDLQMQPSDRYNHNTACATPRETNFVQTLQFEMANFFRTEGDRQHKFNECFANHYQTRLLSLPIGGTKATTDGHIFEIGSATSNWVIMIAEAKNELAGTRADPRFQALLYYQNQIKTYPDNMFDTCCFPAIIITYYAAKLEFSGVLSHPNGIIQSEILTTTLPLDADWRNSEIQMAIAKIAGALENALAGLLAYYKAFNSPAPSMPIKHLLFHFPYQNSYLDSELGPRISFTYTQRPFEDRLIFLGKELEGSKRQIMIKFTRTYSSAVHKELAGLGYAPALHGLQRLPGGWYMVVMEYLDEGEDWMMLYDLPPQLRDGFRPTINTVVDHLHKKGYVHGDIQVGNLFVNIKSGTVKFLDFDEAGVAGEAKYPMNWNTTTVNRPYGAYGGQLITQEHDLFMVKELFKGEYSGRPLDRSINIPKATP
ncbi:hypothetical protein FS842_006981 [Serendipita sp. 407]|nr:hypothetical protein FS842_006981 [Serendipita sp. 407]